MAPRSAKKTLKMASRGAKRPQDGPKKRFSLRGPPLRSNLNRPTKGGKRNEVERRTEWDLSRLYWEGFFIPSPPLPAGGPRVRQPPGGEGLKRS